ncbi:hypothetical protein, partial [Mycoplasma todarodis]
KTTADKALAANEADIKAKQATKDTADQTLTDANTAKTTADKALAANKADIKAKQATKDTADQTLTDANTAKDTANKALAANEADIKAKQATKDTADQTLTDANTAKDTADKALAANEADIKAKQATKDTAVATLEKATKDEKESKSKLDKDNESIENLNYKDTNDNSVKTVSDVIAAKGFVKETKVEGVAIIANAHKSETIDKFKKEWEAVLGKKYKHKIELKNVETIEEINNKANGLLENKVKSQSLEMSLENLY